MHSWLQVGPRSSHGGCDFCALQVSPVLQQLLLQRCSRWRLPASNCLCGLRSQLLHFSSPPAAVIPGVR
jgi:hypothetical protein